MSNGPRGLIPADDGALVIPPEVFTNLIVAGCGFAIEVDESANTVLLRPVPPGDAGNDAWAFTPKFIARARRASANIRAGRLVEMYAERLAQLRR